MGCLSLRKDETVPDFETIRKHTRAVYTQKAAYWHRVRDRSGYEKAWLNLFIQSLPKGSHILDLACGTGDPIAGYLTAHGFHVTGVDYAPTMIELAKQAYPACKWRVADIIDLPDLGRFDGLISWDGFFHLSPAEQREMLPQYIKRIKPGGALLLTVGTAEGEVTGQIDNETVYHASLSSQEYKQILRGRGFSKIVYQAEDPECRGRSVLFASGMRANDLFGKADRRERSRNKDHKSDSE